MTDESAAGAATADENTAADKGDETEAKAREQGWRPKDEWTGKPEHWKDADTYLEHGDLKTRLAKTEERLARVGKTTETAIANLKRAHEKELASLKAQKTAAVRAGDAETVEKLDDAIDALKKDGPEAAALDSDTDETAVEADWALDNPWYGADATMTRYAETFSQGLLKANPNLALKDNLKQVDKKLREKFPDYAWDKKPAARQAGANGHASVDGGGAIMPSTNRRSEPAIPEEDLNIGRQLVKSGAFKDLAAWKKEYLNA